MKPVTREAARLLHDGALAMAEIENQGVRVDVPYLDSQIARVGDLIRRKEDRLRKSKEYAVWRKRFGDKTKLGSREQLATVVFDCLGFERNKVVAKKSRDGDGELTKRESKQNEEAFQKVDLPFVRRYFQTEKLKKLKSTYLEGIRNEVVGGFVHPNYNLHTVVTYRPSCNSPNFMNILARNPKLSEIIRRCYVPREGHQLVENDYSGIEVKIACCYTKDPQLIKEFTGPGGDPHGDTARELFFMADFVAADADEARAFKKGPRDWAKNRFVFPSFYGSVYFQTAPSLWRAVESGAMHPGGKVTMKEHMRRNGITRLGDCSPDAPLVPGTFVAHVKRIEDGFWNKRFRVYTEWKKKWHADYLNRGGFNLYSGFRIEGLFGKNDVLNYAIQGSAFHCELWSIIEIIKAIKKYRMRTRVVGQIYDCDVSDVHPKELQDYLDLQREIKEVRLLKKYPWIIVPMDTEPEVCGIDEPWNAKRVWEMGNDQVWGPKQ